MMPPSLLPFVVAPLLVLLTLYGLSLYQLVRWLTLGPRARRVLALVFAVEVILLLLNVLVWHNLDGYLKYFLDLDEELTFGTMFQSLQLVTIGLSAELIAGLGRLDRLTRGYLVTLGVLFAYVGADEFFVLHERFVSDQNSWPLAYWVSAAVFGVLSLTVFARNLRRHPRFVALVIAGVGVIGFGAVVFEEISWNILCLRTDFCQEYTVIEEALELIGATLILAGLLHLAAQRVPASRRAALIRGTWIGAGVYLILMLAYVYVWPALDLRWRAVSANATYLDGGLEFVGYRLSAPTAQPGDRPQATLYFRANRVLDVEYAYSLHALALSTMESAAQVDDLRVGAYPSTAWIPGVVVSKTVALPLDSDVQTPQSLLLTLRLWSGDWEESWQNTDGLEVESTNAEQLTPDTLVIGHLPLLSANPVAPPTASASYRFGEAITLTGYEVAGDITSGDSLSLRFWWRAVAPVAANLTQFIHLVDLNGDLVVNRDGPPFNGAFPTGDWPAGLQAVDTVVLEIPEELTAGTYTLLTGLYNPVSIARLPVVDPSGNELSDNAIILGQMRVAVPATGEPP